MTKIVKENGDIEYLNEQGEYHREDGPARISVNGDQCWYINGLRHREDGPACVGADGEQQWYHNGSRHRDDGPAVILEDGCQFWYQNGRYHRVNGPAMIDGRNGNQVWCQNGDFHREDGPAVISANGIQKWYLIGFTVTEELVKNLNSLTADLINKYDSITLRSWLIVRMGWPKYLREINAEPIDVRNNEIENTKEALYFISELKQSQLVVTCPTGRVFSLHVPSNIKTCEAAQNWLGNDVKNEFNVIGRT